jgi:hypothetical protein
MKLGMVYASVATVVILWAMDGRAQQVFPPPTSGLRGYEVVLKSANVDKNVLVVSVTCPAGKKVFGGGAKFSPESQSADTPVVYSYPDKLGSGWSGEVKRQTAGSLDVFATCANVP